MIHLSCHCGAVRLSVPALPEKLTSCNCSVCRRTATLMGYYEQGAVRIEGATDGYEHGDRSLSLRRCKACGVVTHWESLDPAVTRMGVNFRNAEPEVVAAIPVRRFDGADSWTFLD